MDLHGGVKGQKSDEDDDQGVDASDGSTVQPSLSSGASTADPSAAQKRQTVDSEGEMVKVIFTHPGILQEKRRNQRAEQHQPPNGRQSEEQRRTGPFRR